MDESEKPALTEKVKTSCPHFWIIDTAGSNTSSGSCKLCGETREFSNTIDQRPKPKQKTNVSTEPTSATVKTDS